ncbi:MAG: hypothetical protein Q8K70_11340 [Bacteroidota bacterium]|nr:hypothetical protein [Bacteroidota bacterium]
MSTDSIQIEALIKKLLYQHECVILPELGGFIVRESPSNINKNTQTVKPLTKTVFFNQNLKENDGLLVSEIQKKFKLSYEEANKMYKNWHQAFMQELKQNQTYLFRNIGDFKMNEDGQIWFYLKPQLNLALETYGLYPVSLQIIEENKQVPENTFKTVHHIDRKPIEEIKTNFKLNYKAWLVAASIALIVHIGYLTLEKSDVTLNEANVLPKLELKNITPTETPTVIEPLENEMLISEEASNLDITTETNNIESESSKITEEPIIKEEIQEEITVSSDTKSGILYRYKLQENANYHQKDLLKKGIVTKVFFTDGWYQLIQM